MKKVILSLFAAGAITTAFAQNSTTLNQTGTQNNSNTLQYGANQNANITQNGQNNINKNEQLSTFYQVANVNQQGNFNTATTSQNNDAGPSNIINVSQTGYGDANSRNNATVTQSNVFTEYSTANVTQRGRNLNATINQLGSVSDNATIEQGGYESGGAGRAQTATINQGNNPQQGGANSNNSTAYIQQLSSFSQEALINQLGSYNKAYIYQNEDAGPDDKATINQNGNNNFALINQSDYETAFGTNGTINQTGNSNTAYLEQLGSTSNFTTGSYANITQNGQNNTTRFHQDGGAYNKADITQTGGYNTVQGLGGAGSFAVQNGGGGNSLTIMQGSALGGPGHTASVSQVGTNQVGVITQITFP